MIFSLAVHAPPHCSSTGSYSAYLFATAALNLGHKIHRIFFYQDGVHNASNLVITAQDEINLPLKWQALAQAHQIDLVICIASALRRGIVDTEEAKRYEKENNNSLDGFTISGLGQLVEAAVYSDRLINFGD